MPCDFVVKNDSKMRSMSVAAIPVPESSTDNSTPSEPWIAVFIVNIRARPDTESIASAAFLTKFRMTCCNWPLWPSTKWERSGQPGLDKNSLRLQIPLHKPKNIVNDTIEVDSRSYLAVFFEHCPNASDHLTSTITSTDDILHGVTRFIEIRRLFTQAIVGQPLHSLPWSPAVV